jgi:hypothetical protein
MRPLEPDDVDTMVHLAIVTGMFPADAAPFLIEQATSWLAAGRGPGSWAVEEVDGQVVAVVFYEPRPATDRVWALTMIVVDPNTKAQASAGG